MAARMARYLLERTAIGCYCNDTGDRGSTAAVDYCTCLNQLRWTFVPWACHKLSGSPYRPALALTRA